MISLRKIKIQLLVSFKYNENPTVQNRSQHTKKPQSDPDVKLDGLVPQDPEVNVRISGS
jgi:hypothetical protein